jgi:PAS domain S-box-containing protein
MPIIPDPSHNTWRIPWHLVIIFSFLAAGILGLGYYFAEYQEIMLQKANADELTAIADLKVKQIVAWRQQRLDEAQLIFEDRRFAEEVQNWFKGNGSPEQENRVRQRMDELYRGSYVEAVLFDSQGRERLSMSKVKPDHRSLIKMVASKAMAGGKVIFTDLYFLHRSEEINMSLAIPIQVQVNDQKIVVGAVVYQIDPYYFLYPLLQSWPTPSDTGELVLVRRDPKNHEIIFLNELRHRKGAPLMLQEPLTETQRPSVKAALGEEGIVRGIDYRKVAVLAVNRTIPHSPWFLTAKIDIAEVNAPLRKWSYLIPILTLTMMASAGLGTALLWRNRDVQFYRRQYQLESERRSLSQRYEYLMKYAYDIILLTDKDWKIIEANDRAVNAFGYAREELFNLYLWDLFSDHYFMAEPEKLEQEAQAGFRFEATNCRRNGSTFPAEISASLLDKGDNRIYQYVIRDVSGRKSKEKALRESARQLRFLSSQLLIVQENERRRIAKELHDEVGQALMILKFHISSIDSRLSDHQQVLKNECQSLLNYLDSTIENVRRLSWDLSPSALEQFGLATAIRNLLEQFSLHFTIHWEPSQLESLDHLFPPVSQINIYRVFQESLTNISRHAQATDIVIDIKKQDGYVTCVIKDNGRGFDPRAVAALEKGPRGIGLATMEQRTRIAGGRLEINSSPQTGTELTLTIPLTKESNS